MMKSIYALLACLASGFLAVSCSESEVNDVIDNSSKDKYFIIGAPSTNGTRACIENGNVNAISPAVIWEETDQINVWGKGSTNSCTYKFLEFRELANSAVFEKVSGNLDLEAGEYFVMYPAQSGATLTADSKISARIPEYQKAVANTFDPAAALFTGNTKAESSRDVELEHSCAFFKITTEKPCYSVTVKACNESWYLTGDVLLSTSSSGSRISFTGVSNPCNFVKLTKNGTSNTSETFPAGTYLMSFACSTEFPGLDITVDYGDGDKPHVVNDKTFQFANGYIYNLGTAKSTLGN